jgi:hypothetical protein
MAFVPNQDQSGTTVSFRAYGAGNKLTFTPQEIVMDLPGVRQPLRLRFVDFNPATTLAARESLPTRINDFRGSDPSNWSTNLPTYAAVHYQELYPGVELRYEGIDGSLKSTFTVAPGADPSRIQWQYSGAAAVAVDDATGDLLVTLPDQTQVVEKAPIAWQQINGRRISVPVAYTLTNGGSVASFALGNYNPSLPLIIDPTIVYETTLDLGGFDRGHDIAIDAAGNAFVLGRVYDTNNDVLIAKLSPNGTLLYATYLRGSKLDYGGGIALDDAGGVYIAGLTDSDDFPILNAVQAVKNGVTRDAFITKLAAADGSLMFSTYFGGSRSDEIHDITLNSTGEIYLVGYTESTDFPMLNPIQAGLNLNQCFCEDTFVTKLSPDGMTVLYSTYLGGSFEDYGESIALDANDNIYITGHTQSDDFPTQAAIQPNRAGEFQDEDLFVSKISADGSNLVYSTYLGGTGDDSVRRIAVTSAGNATVAGSTRSRAFPTTPGAYQETYIGGILDCGTAGFGGPVDCYDMFVTQFAPDGSSLVYSTYLGGGLDDFASGVALNDAGEAFVVGYTQSTDFPGVTRTGPGADIAVAKLDASGSDLVYTAIIDSSTPNAGHGIGIDDSGDVVITGSKTDFYVAKISDDGTISPTPTSDPPTPTPTPVPPTPTPAPSVTLHAGDLDGSSSWVFRKRVWQGSATVAVHDADHNPVIGATVYGTWSGGFSGAVQCATGNNGSCTLHTDDISRKTRSTTFTLNAVEHPSLPYAAADNHDPDSDSNGTSITVSRP